MLVVSLNSIGFEFAFAGFSEHDGKGHSCCRFHDTFLVPVMRYTVHQLEGRNFWTYRMTALKALGFHF